MKTEIRIRMESRACPDNYYHYLCDFVQPLYRCLSSKFFDRMPKRIIVKSEFPDRYDQYKNIAALVFPETDFKYESSGGKVDFVVPKSVKSRRGALANFSKHVVRSVQPKPKALDVILIERSTHPRKPSIADGRPHIRFLDNHANLNCAISDFCKSKNLRFDNVKPERYTFQEQVEIFSSAKCVIGQHGAGLTNVLWMRPQAYVLEIQVSKRPGHYRRISNAMGLHYAAVLGSPVERPKNTFGLFSHERGRDEVSMANIPEILKYLNGIPAFSCVE